VVIAATLACAIALPPLMILMPEWRVGILPPRLDLPLAKSTPVHTHLAPSVSKHDATLGTPQSIRPVLVTSALDAPASNEHTASIHAPFSPSASEIALGIWMLGVLFGLAWIAIGQLGLAHVRRHATPLRSIDWRALLELERMHAGVAADVALLSSPKVSTPVTWGIFKPVIVLPDSARSWTEDRKRVVVRHEMAHIARRDSATQLAATLASVIYWMHPLVILASRHLRGECERACDERVLEMGTPATDYAAHLLDVARFARSFGAASVVSVAMARPSQLEGRLLAVLRAAPSRGRMSVRARASALVTAAMMLIAISAFKPVAKEAKTSPKARAGAGAVPSAKDAPSESARLAHNARVQIQVTVDTGSRTRPHITVAAPPAPATPSAPAAPAASAAPAAPAVIGVPAATAAPAAAAQPASPARPAEPAMFPRIATFARVFALPKVAEAFPGLARTLRLDLARPYAPVATPDFLSDSTFEKSVTVRPGGTLELDLDTGGDVEIIGTDDQKVSVRGSLGGEDWRETTIALEEHDGNAKLVSRYIGSSSQQSFDNSFTIRVPKHFNVRVESAGGGVHINGVDGSFSGYTGGGNLALERANGDAHLSTGGGDVRVAKSKLDGSVSTGGGTVHFEDVSGSIVGNSGSERHQRRGYSYSFKMPDVEAFSRMPEMDPEMLESTRDAMRASKEAMKESQKAMMRAQERMLHDGTLERMDTAMMRARIRIERNRGAMDSARTMMEDIEIDTADMPKRHEKIRFRMMDGHNGTLRSRNGMIEIDKDGGDIQLDDAPAGAHVTTGGGAIIVGRSGGVVSAETGGGDIDIERAESSADATTGAGNVSINLVGEKPHPVNITSGTGDVEVVLPKDANATLDLETAYTENHSHTKIKGDWSLNVTETDQWDDSQGSPRKYVRVKQNIGKGGPVIRVRTVNGDIRIKQGS
ncbi:MAG: M56 family metallopeptidase, partial [Gemmatimonas sp.]